MEEAQAHAHMHTAPSQPELCAPAATPQPTHIHFLSAWIQERTKDLDSLMCKRRRLKKGSKLRKYGKDVS